MNFLTAVAKGEAVPKPPFRWPSELPWPRKPEFLASNGVQVHLIDEGKDDATRRVVLCGGALGSTVVTHQYATWAAAVAALVEASQSSSQASNGAGAPKGNKAKGKAKGK